MSKREFSNPFAKRRRRDIPDIRVEQDVGVAPEARHTSQDSRMSDTPMLPQPAHTVYGNQVSVAGGSDGSLMIGRLV